MERRLAAVLAADVVGYSRLMEQDEAGTLTRVRAQVTEVLEPAIRNRGGRIVKLMGDGVLADFASAVNAVECAVDVQERIARFDPERVGSKPLQLRIGINLGDILVDGDDIFGDGVNIACRLEGMADPGGIFISGTAFDTVDGKLDRGFVDVGPLALKNISKPVRAYRVVLPQMAPAHLAPAPEPEPQALPSKPSIAVLPFINLSADPEQQYFADGITEDIITNLAKCRWTFVIARHSTLRYQADGSDVGKVGRELGVRYVLEGAVRRSGDQIRVTCKLVEAASGAHLWGERFDRRITDIFELQDEITRSVVAVIEPTLKQAEIDRIRRRRPDSLGAYELYLHALQHMYKVRPEVRAPALTYAGRALEIDPAYAEAHGVAAWCYFAKSLWDGSPPAPYREPMLAHARAVQELTTDDASTLAHAAVALTLATHDYHAALSMIDRAIASNPSSVHAFGHGSVINTWAGNYDRSIAFSDIALRLSPFDPLSVMPLAGQAGARLMKQDYAGAAEFAERALQVYPTHTPSFLILITSLIRRGRIEEARATAGRLMETTPSYRIIATAPVLGHFVAELQAAGLPDASAA